MSELAALAEPDPVLHHPCVECAVPTVQSEMTRFENHWICPPCTPKFFQRIREGVPLPGAVAYAQFGTRLAAKFIDGLITQAGIMMINFGVIHALVNPASSAATIANIVVATVVNLIYTTWFVGRHAATPGKLLLKLRVINADGNPMTYRRALARYFAEWLSGLTLCVGYIIAGFDREHRALHDHLCNTRVIVVP